MSDDNRKAPPGNPSSPSARPADRRDRAPWGTTTREFRPTRGGTLLIGRLVEHGAAPYQFRTDENLSYYVKILSSGGPKTLWGKDLARALESGETRPKVGDLIGARRSGREAVTVTARRRSPEGRVILQESQHAHRTRWVVETVQFFAHRARLARRLRDEQRDVRETVREHPELKSTFLSVRAAEDFAARRIADPKDRERFLALMREAMAASIQKGEPLPTIPLRSRSQTQDWPTAIPKPPQRDEPAR